MSKRKRGGIGTAMVDTPAERRSRAKAKKKSRQFEAAARERAERRERRLAEYRASVNGNDDRASSTPSQVRTSRNRQDDHQ